MENTEIEVLLVEDNRNDAELTIRALEKNKIAGNIVHVKDGASALDFLFCRKEFIDRDIKNKPKVIFADLKMPKVDGIELLKKIRENELTRSIPVVVFTSSKESKDIEKSFANGANSYIVKPVDFAEFMKVISDVGRYWLTLNQHLS